LWVGKVYITRCLRVACKGFMRKLYDISILYATSMLI
jgi:hypothetical protein